MAINVIGFRWGDSDENHKYDYEALENKPTADLGVLDIDTTAEQGTDDGDLYRAIHSISWDNVINTLSGVLNVKKLFTRLVNQVKTNTDTLSDPGQLVEDAIGSYDTASSVVSSDTFIKRENDGEIKQVTPLNVLKGGVRGLNRTASYSDKDVPIISTSDTSDISKSSISSVTKAGLYNLATGSASELSADLSDKIVIETPPASGALDPAYIEKHQLSEIYNLFEVGNKVDMTDALLNLDTTQAPTTTDGALYEAITNIGWGAVISNQLMDLKALLTKISNALYMGNTEYTPTYITNNYYSTTAVNRLRVFRTGPRSGVVRINLANDLAAIPSTDTTPYEIASFSGISFVRDVFLVLPSQNVGTYASTLYVFCSGNKIVIANYSGANIVKSTFFRINIPVVLNLDTGG